MSLFKFLTARLSDKLAATQKKSPFLFFCLFYGASTVKKSVKITKYYATYRYTIIINANFENKYLNLTF